MICWRRKLLLEQESGQAIVEFCIVFPVLFLLILTIIQASQLYIAKQMVNYAAYCSARSAMVWLGVDHPSPGKAKEKATRAAVIACIPISPNSDVKNESLGKIFGDSDPIESLKSQITDFLIQSFLSGFDCFKDLAEYKNRFRWSEELTKVDIYGSGGSKIDSGTKMVRKDVTAVVTHDYAMRIPLINKIFFYLCSSSEIAQQEQALHGGPKGGLTLNPFSEYKDVGEISDMSYYTLPIQASCTLTVEGKEEVEDKKG